MYFLGMDVGTGGTRAVLIDGQGAIVASAQSEHAAFRAEQPGWAEQDPEDWWRAAQAAIRDTLKQASAQAGAQAASQIAGVGLTGQMHGAVMLDRAGEVLRPALIWCDQRTGPQCDWLHRELGREHLIDLVANPALPNFTLTKLLWVREHQPEIYANIAHILCPKDYVRLRLTGAYAMDVQEASGTLLLDVAHRRWSSEVAKAAGVSEDWLPELFESPQVCAAVSPEAAQATGLTAGTPVVAGAGDQGAGAVGMGILEPGSVSVTIGTSGVVFAATAQPTKDPQGRLHTFCHAVPGLWHVMGVTQAAGLSLRWLRDLLTPGAGYDTLTAAAASVAPGSDGLLYTPYLLGERTPHLDSHATASFVGLRADHGRGHLARAVLEGVAYSLKDSFTLFDELGIPVTGVRLGGGGARGPLWRQIQADIYAHPCDLLVAEEGGAYGAALLAGVGGGGWPDVQAACAASIRVAQQIVPQPAAVERYRRGYQGFRQVYPALAGVRG
ncbi:MAG TPA: xylulokinase [Acidobacteriaceae bacterium]